MADYDVGEAKMFAKWHATRNLLDNEDFWADCRVLLLNKVFTLPFPDTEANRAVFAEACAKYSECIVPTLFKQVPVSEQELQFMKENIRSGIRNIVRSKNDVYLDMSQGCPFSRNRSCSIKKFCPDFCSRFPVMPPFVSVSDDGETFYHLQVLACYPEVIDVIKTLYKMAFSNHPEIVILPDLSVVANQ